MNDKTLMDSHRSNIYSNFLMHWKYIKREKVGDKWKYFYDDGKKTEAAANEAKTTVKQIKTKLDSVNDTIELKNKLILNENKKIVDAKMDYKKAVDLNKARLAEGKKTLDMSYELGDAYSRQISSKHRKSQLLEEKASLENRKTTLESDLAKAEKEVNRLSEEYANSPRAKGYTTSDKIKDALGVDEREAYKDAKAAYENATDKKNEADKEAEKARRRFLDDPKSDYKADDAILKVNMLRFWREKERKRGEEYINAKTEYMDTPLGTALKISEAVKDIPFEVENAIDKIGNKIASIGKKDSSKETLSDVNGKNIPQKVIEQEVITDKDIPSKKNEIVKTFNNSSKTSDDNAETWDDATGVIPKASKNKSADVTRNAAGWIDAKRELTDKEIKAETEQAKEMFDSYFKYHHKLEDCQSSIFFETSADIDPKTKVETGTYTSTIYLKKNDGQHLTVSQITKTDKNTSDVKKIRDAISDYYMEKKFGENWDSVYRPLKKK